MVRDATAPWAEEVLVTANDLAALPDAGWRYELVAGRLVRVPPTGLEHGALDVRLSAALLRFTDERGLGLVTGAETGFLVSRPGEPDTVLAPDVAFIAADRVPVQASSEWTGYPRLVPDLAVEIASPSQHRPEMAINADLWLHAGVRLLWIAWPAARQVDIWQANPPAHVTTFEDEDVLDGGSILPGFTFPLAQLWR